MSSDQDAPPPAPTGMDDPLVGSTLAERYQVLRRIGEGGMGAVYEARHTVLGKRVAVKLLLEKLTGKSELVARLLQEARLASAIGHENIVDVTDFGTADDGRAYVVMEFLDGESVAGLLTREAPLPVERCLRIARQVAGALEAAHGKGIVHRDIKPENVYLIRRADQDFVKVVDFGVSKAARTADDGTEMLRLTRTGILLGTPLYMSPEQARGDEDVDGRADVWAVGVLLYECLTGEVPFRANNYLGVISQVLTQDATPPRVLRPELGIPAAVESVVMRAMEKDRTQRYQSMADLERDIERLLEGDQNVGVAPAPAPAPIQEKPPTRWYLGIAAVLALGAGVALALSRSEGPGDPRSASTGRTPAGQAKPATTTGSTTTRSASPGAAASGAPAASAPGAAGASASRVVASASRAAAVSARTPPAKVGDRAADATTSGARAGSAVGGSRTALAPAAGSARTAGPAREQVVRRNGAHPGPQAPDRAEPPSAETPESETVLVGGEVAPAPKKAYPSATRRPRTGKESR